MGGATDFAARSGWDEALKGITRPSKFRCHLGKLCRQHTKEFAEGCPIRIHGSFP
jgi:hypothetical protein